MENQKLDEQFDVEDMITAAEDEAVEQIKDRVVRKAKRPSSKFSDLPILIGGDIDSNVTELDGNGLSRAGKKISKALSKNSRRPRSRYGKGHAKKGGAGGKGTWGAPGSEFIGDDETVDDPNDPNYNSDNQDDCKLDVISVPLDKTKIETIVTPMIKEYFENGDTEEVLITLDDLNFGVDAHQILVIIVSLALDRKSSHCEMASVLISDLYGRVLEPLDIKDGFQVLLDSLPELVLDTPNAATVLGNFVARAIADDCIAPIFLQTYKPQGDDNKHAKEAVEHAQTLLNMKNGLTKLDTVWGITGSMRPVKYLIRQIRLIINEYNSSQDLSEATRCIRELDVPHFHHEFVYEAVVIAIEDMKDSTVDSVCNLLKSFADSAIITCDQLRNGINRVYEDMLEITIDVPHAYQVLEKLVNKGNSLGFIPDDLKNELPQRGRKRFVSEGDGGRIKE